MAEIPEVMVEKVARALAMREWGSEACFDAVGHDPRPSSLECAKCRADTYVDLARAALSALPIGEMVEALGLTERVLKGALECMADRRYLAVLNTLTIHLADTRALLSQFSPQKESDSE